MHPIKRLIWILVLIFLVCRRYLRYWIRYASIHSIQSDELQWIKYQEKPRVPTSRRTVVTMTTIPSRIDLMYYSLYSILSQTHRVDEIIINLPYTSLKGKEYIIPKWMKRLARTHPVTLHRCTDLGPITKLAPTLERYQHEQVIVIVVDDDVIYKERHLYQLCQLSRDYPNHAISGTGYRVLNKDGSKRTYESVGWGLKHVDVLMGVSGYLVTTRMFQYDTFMAGRLTRPEYIYVDDNYISLYLASRSIPILAMKYGSGLSCPEFANLTKMIFNRDSDSLCRNANKPSADGWFGENESLILSDHGMYLNQWNYFQFYFF